MISHKYKAIFIHIPRTAGSSIEHWLLGEDYWAISKENKHLIASRAKELYKDYWDTYFKFAVVRNPWSRMVSCLQFQDYFKLNVDNGIIDFSGYKEQWGHPIIVENDYRFSDIDKVKNASHTRNQVYGNMIDEELDYIGLYENLPAVIRVLKDALNIPHEFNSSVAKSTTPKNYIEYYNESTKNEVYDMFRNDIIKYNYKFNDNN